MSTPPNARELFAQAIALDKDRRKSLLDQARALAPEVCAEVESLLAYHDGAGSFLDRPAVESEGSFKDFQHGTEPVPERLGRYSILRVLGTGGMGIVYEARQDSPRRAVALKVIRPGILAPGLLKRFTHEAAALARLQHPGIAQVFDAGVFDGTGAGRPFIAMELVDGRPLTEAARDLPMPARLELFAKVCDAVEHAHRRSVVHRDLKPGNILVTTEGNPKVLDFGVARLTDAEAHVTTVSTSVGQIIGTLSYMSPEQASGDPSAIDERADVYALGVILHELLTGQLPLDLGRAPVHEAVRAIAHDEPRPVSSIDRRLRGDLDTITRRALEKDKTRRYQHASDLAADVRRHLAHEPIAARPPSTFYQLSKFARRNRTLVGGVVAVFVTLVAGIVATSWQAVNASEQAVRARETAAFLKRMIRAATPEETRGQDTTVREMLDGAARDLMADASVHPAVAADTHRMFAEAYAKLGDFRAAEEHARRALTIQESRVGPDHPDALVIIPALSSALVQTDRAAEALPMVRRAFEAAERTLGPDHEATYMLTSALAFALAAQNPVDWPEVLKWRRRSCELHSARLGPEDRETLTEYSNLGVELMESRQIDEAQKVFNTVLEARQRRLGPEHPDTLVAMANVGAVLQRRGEIAALVPLFEDLVKVSRRVLGPQHPSTLVRLRNLAVAYFQSGRLADAEAVAKETYEGSTARLGPNHSGTISALGMYASAVLFQKHVKEAEPLVHRVYEAATANFPEKSPGVVNAISLEYDLAEHQGDLAAMRRWAEKLRGTELEQAVFEQLKAAEEAARGSTPPPNPPK